MKKYSYFEVPTQVQFWDYKKRRYKGGIAYRDEIICGCCGGVFNISEIYKVAPDTLLRDPIIAYDDWVGISSAMFE
jgi:hypothetical protein